MAGRGFGKTRTGVEDALTYCMMNDGVRYAVVAPTQSDLRKVCFEGDSGLIQNCPAELIKGGDWNKNMYELSLWNGSLIQGFSADRPNRLRGPQFSRGWCLAPGTLVTMADGSQKVIQDVIVDDFVMTRKGPRRVLRSWMTSPSSNLFEVTSADGRTIQCTADHKVWSDEHGFISAASLKQGDTLCVINAFYGKGKNGADIQRCIISGLRQKIKLSKLWLFTEKSIKNTKDQFLKASTSTTWMKINQIITQTILKLCQDLNTCDCTTLVKNGDRGQKNSNKSLKLLLLIDHMKKALVCIAKKFSTPIQENLENFASLSVTMHTSKQMIEAETCHAYNAKTLSPNTTYVKSIVRRSAETILDILKKEKKKFLAKVAEKLWSRLRLASDFVLDPVLEKSGVSSIADLDKLSPVYDLTIEGEPEFFANGILVHNCDEISSWRYPDAWDMLEFGMRLGKNPQTIVTSTPKPVPLVKALVRQKGVIITLGSTFENEANLAARFLDRIKEKYEGTRLGSQELYGMLLEDFEGALWKRSMLRYVKPEDLPRMIRVVVAVDPAVTAHEDSDETGIIVVGLGVDGNYYVLDDLTGKYKPNEWASKAHEAYKEWQADCVVAEVNNGGDLVESVLRNVDPFISYKQVRASRGKVVRAEPVAQLYEKAKVYHLGVLSALEDQMCEFDPAHMEKSPDRVDALVWGVTELAGDTDVVRLRRL